MVRVPCCEKMGMKKGPWSPEEDQILVSHIHQHGHGNWRALPKQAGLLRCGKSCRLRWTNYLRLDIKRGNFSKEEEETIIKLHEMLGNRWSAIAASLPGRTDNEIKNVWNTRLKKKLKYDSSSQFPKSHSIVKIAKCDTKLLQNSDSSVSEQIVTSPQQYSNEMSSITNHSLENLVEKNEEIDYSSEYSPQIDESFWSDELSINSPSKEKEKEKVDVKVAINALESGEMDPKNDESMDFWYNLFIRAGDMPDLAEF